ncbi:MAG: AAA family ATPase, partial [Planctomycetes bacterium]|nr:AAA family ATPase [Planctomycetota bacterium]
MKILAVRGHNLASLAGRFELDLARGPLAGVGLFAITGPVGAGKSTLLDALCLPLFDRTPRLSGRGGTPIGEDGVPESDWLRAHDPRTLLRRDAAEGSAEVDFVGRDGRRYRARWSVRRARLRREGRLQDQELVLFDLERNTPLASGRKSEVLLAIQQRLGLDFQQFCRSVLLAQGEFAAFLRAAADERARLLETLTGGDVYRRLSRAAHERRRSFEQRLVQLRGTLAGLEVLDADARARIAAATAELQRERDLAQTGVDLASRYVAWYGELARLRQQESDATLALQAAIVADEAARAERARVARLQAALPLQPFAEQVQARQRNLVAATGAQVAAEARTGSARAALAKTEQRLRDDCRSELGSDAVPTLVTAFAEWRTALSHWQRARQQLASLEQALPRLATAAAAAAAAATAAAATTATVAAAHAAARAQLAQARQAVERPELAALAAQRGECARQQRELAAAEQSLRDLAAFELRAHEATVAAQEADTAAARLAAGRAAGEAAVASALAHREAAEQQAEALRTRHHAAQLVPHLEPGAPCPVCGSAEHPAPAHDDPLARRAAATALAAADAALQQARDERAAQAARLAAASAAREQAQQQLARLQERVAAATAAAAVALGLPASATAADCRTALAVRQQECHAAGAQLALAEQQRDAAQTSLLAASQRVELAAARAASAEREQAAAAAAAAAAATAVQRAHDDLAQARAALAAARTDLQPALDSEGLPWSRLEALGEAVLPTVQRLAALAAQARAEHEARAAAEAAAATAATALAAARSELALANTAFQCALADRGVAPSDVQDATALGARALDQAAQRLAALEQAVATQRSAVQTLVQVRRDREDRDRPAIAESDAQQALADARSALAASAAQLQKCQAQLAADDLLRARRAELAPVLATAEQDARVWQALDELIGSSTGDAFAVFAQGLTLDLLLVEANRRLRDLAPRYELRRNHGTDLDFVVVDRDLGGTRRSLQTLSGGETFLVSLALALGLASLAAPRARIETLFLDEGFGTLDAQSLEQALGA